MCLGVRDEFLVTMNKEWNVIQIAMNGFFLDYSVNNKVYQVFNNRIKSMTESINVIVND